MRLLFVAPQPPFPPVKGGAIRLWGLLRALAERHELHVHCLSDGELSSGVAGQRGRGTAGSRDSKIAGERATGKSHRQQRGGER
ncbi:MAG: hypothetical protein HY329_03915 [Chloroflexi bacterium]|nr:hypothetical protein [Chloroflexota bacterium]